MTADDHNFGTLLRLKASSDYSEENSMFGQFALVFGQVKSDVDQSRAFNSLRLR